MITQINHPKIENEDNSIEFICKNETYAYTIIEKYKIIPYYSSNNYGKFYTVGRNPTLDWANIFKVMKGFEFKTKIYGQIILSEKGLLIEKKIQRRHMKFMFENQIIDY